MDAPGGWFDHKGRVLETHPGSPFERLFGAHIEDFQYGNNVRYHYNGADREGFILETQPTTATVTASFANGVPAVTENSVGKGSACLLAWSASHDLFAPGNRSRESELGHMVLGEDREPFYSCDGAYVYRLAAPAADHYFFINDGPARRVSLHTGAMHYTSVSDAVSGENLSIGHPIELEAESGRWLRFAKA